MIGIEHTENRDIVAGLSTPKVTERGVKSTWITRRVPDDLQHDWAPVGRVSVGDLLLCEVIHPSLHSRIEARNGAHIKLYSGDRIVCAVGNRYATSFFEAIADIRGDQAHLLSSSGLCGLVQRQNEKASRPTTLRVIAQAVSAGRPVNLQCFTRGAPAAHRREPRWILVVGSAMDSGKTTACTALIHGLVRSGLRVGAAKLTGTASTRDLDSFRDAGATTTLDFLDCGWPSTAGCTVTELTDIAWNLLGHLRAADIDVAVLEIADGVLQTETVALLHVLRGKLADPRIVLTVSESLAGVAGVDRLKAMEYDVAAVSGVVTNSVLARHEIEEATGVRCIITNDLVERAPALAGLACCAANGKYS